MSGQRKGLFGNDTTDVSVAELFKNLSTERLTDSQVKILGDIFGANSQSIVRGQWASHKGASNSSVRPLENDQGREMARNFILALGKKYTQFVHIYKKAYDHAGEEIQALGLYDLTKVVEGENERFTTDEQKFSAEYICYRIVHNFRLILKKYFLMPRNLQFSVCLKFLREFPVVEKKYGLSAAEILKKVKTTVIDMALSLSVKKDVTFGTKRITETMQAAIATLGSNMPFSITMN